jgi:hypothetical protein
VSDDLFFSFTVEKEFVSIVEVVIAATKKSEKILR